MSFLVDVRAPTPSTLSIDAIIWLCYYSTDIVRSHTSFNILPIELKESSREELRDLFRALSDIEVEDRCLDVFAEASGFAAEYFLERFQALRNMSSELWKEGQPALVETSEDLIFHIPPRLVRKNKDIKVSEIKAEIAMLFASLVDEIPPLCQMVLKIVTIATRRGFYKLPYKILGECMNDLIANGVECSVLDVILAELVEIFVIKFEGANVAKPAWNDVLSIQNPALADTAMEVSSLTALDSEPNFEEVFVFYAIVHEAVVLAYFIRSYSFLIHDYCFRCAHQSKLKASLESWWHGWNRNGEAIIKCLW